MSNATRIMQSQSIMPPPDYNASVLLKQVAHEQGRLGEPGQRIYICWLIAGRHSARAATASYEHDGIDTIRVDVPASELMSRGYLEQQLREFYEQDPTLPPDTPVIKGIV